MKHVRCINAGAPVPWLRLVFFSSSRAGQVPWRVAVAVVVVVVGDLPLSSPHRPQPSANHSLEGAVGRASLYSPNAGFRFVLSIVCLYGDGSEWKESRELQCGFLPTSTIQLNC